MALTLTIGGVSMIGQMKKDSARIRERLNNQANEFRFVILKKTGGLEPQEGQEVVYKDGARFLFGGYISKIDPTETGKGSMIEYVCEATDYTYVLINKIVAENYAGMTLSAIVNDLITNYVNAGYGITTTNVSTGPTITTIGFNYVTLRKAFEKLAQVTGYEWYIDYEKDVHFFAPDSTPAPESFTDSSTNFTSIDISTDTSQVRNSIVVRGGKEETVAAFDQDFAGDGEAREWILREKPKTMVGISLNTGSGFSSQTYGVDPIDDEGANYFMFNYQEKYVRLTAGQPTPTSSHIVRASYKYEVPVLVLVTSASSIAAMKALEGGDGVHATVINRPDIKSKKEAREVALNEIEQYGNPLVSGVIRTRSGLLGGSSIFKPGQALTLNLPTWGINSDTQFLIQELEIAVLEEGTNIKYDYTITFGGRLIGIKEFLAGLIGEEVVLTETETVDKIQAFEEIVSIAESIARNPLLLSETASMAVSESISRTNTTPPFKWAPSGTKKAVWNEFEWG